MNSLELCSQYELSVFRSVSTNYQKQNTAFSASHTTLSTWPLALAAEAAGKVSHQQLARLQLGRMLSTQDTDMYEAGTNLARYIARYSSSVVTAQMFQKDEEEAFSIFKRQAEIDIWHRTQSNEAEIKRLFHMRDPVTINQAVADKVLVFKIGLESKLKEAEDKISQQIDSIAILTNRVNQMHQHMQEYLRIEEFQKYTHQQDQRFKQTDKKLEEAQIDWSVDKNNQIAEYRGLLTKCEEGLKVVAFNDEMFNSLNEQVKEIQRQVWQVEKDVKEVDRRVLQKRVQPIEKRMEDIDKEIVAINRVQDQRTPQQQRNDMFFGAMRLLSNMEDTTVTTSLVQSAPNYLTDIKGSKRRRNSTLGIINTDRQSNSHSRADDPQNLFKQPRQSEPRVVQKKIDPAPAFDLGQHADQSKSEGGRFQSGETLIEQVSVPFPVNQREDIDLRTYMKPQMTVKRQSNKMIDQLLQKDDMIKQQTEQLKYSGRDASPLVTTLFKMQN